MVQVNEMLNGVVVDNVVVINGVELPKLTDEETVKVMKYIDTLVKGRGVEESSGKVSTPVAKIKIDDNKGKVTGVTLAEEEPKKVEEIPGTPVWKEDFLTITKVDKSYRAYITCFVKDEKGKKIRYAIKASLKDAGAKFGGDFDKKDIFWVFDTKKAADKYIETRKAYAEKKFKEEAGKALK